jgi:hypothetical protein
MGKKIVKVIVFLFHIVKISFGCHSSHIDSINYILIGPYSNETSYTSAVITTKNETYGVEISYQNLTELCCKILNITREIIFMNIDNCNVTKFETECFYKKIQKVSGTIRIRNNNFESIKNGTFQNLMLKFINLVNNKIKVIEDKAFVNLPNLESINLSQNRLRRLNPNAIISTSCLYHVDFGYNFIEFLEKGSFSFIEIDCTIICLWHNRISGVDKDVFLDSTAANLNLHLEFNSIESLPETIFNGHSFHMISMQHNPFKIFSNKFCESNCRIYSFHFDCKPFDEKSLQLIVIWAIANDAEYYFEDILDCNSVLGNGSVIKRNECGSGAECNSHDLKNLLDILLLASIMCLRAFEKRF